MKSSLLCMAATLTFLTGCGGSSDSTVSTASAPGAAQAPSQPTQAETLDTTQVKALAVVTSETTDPVSVNAGAVAITPMGDQSSDPMPMNNAT